jgi:hypothetical protein
MNEEFTRTLIRCHRGWQAGAGHTRIARALRDAQKNDALLSSLVEQTAFDAECVEAIRAITPPGDLRERLREVVPAGPALHHFWRHPILAAGFAGFLLIAGLVAFWIYSEMRSFPGQESAEAILSTTNKLSAEGMEPVGEGSVTAGALGDWFFLKFGLEQYSVPVEFAAVPALGCRVFREAGKPVALVAVDDKKESALFLIYKAADFKTNLAPDGHWHRLEAEGWSAAVRAEGANCFMVAMRGLPADLDRFLNRYAPARR